jgi:hypothetical protein
MPMFRPPTEPEVTIPGVHVGVGDLVAACDGGRLGVELVVAVGVHVRSGITEIVWVELGEGTGAVSVGATVRVTVIVGGTVVALGVSVMVGLSVGGGV